MSSKYIWIPPNELGSPCWLIAELKLEGMPRLNFEEECDLHCSRYKLVFICVVSSQEALDYYCHFLRKFEESEAVVICTLDALMNLQLGKLRASRTFCYSEKPKVLDLKPDYAGYTFSSDRFTCLTAMADFYWPDMSYHPSKILDHDKNPIFQLSVLPLPIYNPDGSSSVNFSNIAKIVYRRQTDKPELSIVIPHYENFENLCWTLTSLSLEIEKVSSGIEVVVVDDGSSSFNFEKFVSRFKMENLKVIRLSRRQNRQMGDCSYRAGVARNAGVEFADAEKILFLDCDILIGASAIERVIKSHSHADMIMLERYQLNPGVRKEIARLNSETDVNWQATPYWTDFYNSVQDWNSLPHRWKYVSTYALSVKRSVFLGLGQFSSSFVSYGSEDVDLGFRAFKEGLKFLLVREKVFHMQPLTERSEFQFDFEKRRELLLRSYYYLFSLHQDREIFDTLLRDKIGSLKNTTQDAHSSGGSESWI